MEIKHENINIVLNKHKFISQKRLREEQELIKRFSENLSAMFENDFGQFDTIAIRNDLEEIIFTYNELSKFGYKNSPIDFAHTLEAITNKNKQIIITICVRDINRTKPKYNGFFDKLKRLFFTE